MLLGQQSYAQSCDLSPSLINWVTPGTTGGTGAQSANIPFGTASVAPVITGPRFVGGPETTIIRINETTAGNGTYTINFPQNTVHDLSIFLGNVGNLSSRRSAIIGNFGINTTGAALGNAGFTVLPSNNNGYFTVFGSDTGGIASTTFTGTTFDAIHDPVSNGRTNQAYGMVDFNYVPPAALSTSSDTISSVTFDTTGNGSGPTAVLGVTARIRTCVTATDDDFSATPIDGSSGGSTASVFAMDFSNSTAASQANVAVTIGTLPSPPASGGISIATDGTVVVAAGTTAGTYIVPYQICENHLPTNCDTAEVTVVVDPTGIAATDDTPPAVDGAAGATIPNVVTNDTLGGVANPTIGTDVTVNESGTAEDGVTTLGLDVTPAAGGITLDPATGEITVAPGTTAGTYTLTYEICEVLNPTNCDTATATVVVDATPIVANDDTPPAIEGVTGGTIPNVVANDTLGGVANPTIGTDVTVSESGTAQDGTTALGLDVTPAAGGITLDPATGIVTVLPGTTGGVYNYTYEICEVLNPTNCDTATVIIGVTPFDLIARIEVDLTDILEEDLASTLTMQSNQISGYSADALDRLRGRDNCLAGVNARLADQNILFNTDSAIIRPESQRTLDEIALILDGCPGSAFEIAGHTDSDASDAYNLDLSQRRVDAVLRALTSRDVDTTDYIARGYGESQPIASNTTAVGKARNRRVEFRALTDEDGYHGSCEDSFSLVRAFDAQANDDGANADGHFLRDEHDCITDRREVFEGTLSFSDTNLGQTQTAINLSYRREQYRGSDSVFGYFVGLYGSQSDVSSRATGEILGLGINAGIYGANRLHDELFLDYYLGAATGRHEFDLAFDRSIGTITATGDYRYIAGFAGAALSGELEYGETTLTPRVGFDYVYTPGADVDVMAQIGALSEAGDLELDAISGGRIFAEVRTDRLIWNDTANFWFNPRISCYQSLGSLDGVCGFGGAIGVESTDEDSDLTYSLGLNGEWGSDHFLGSLTVRASRQIGRGFLSGNAGLNADGNVTMGANYNLDF